MISGQVPMFLALFFYWLSNPPIDFNFEERKRNKYVMKRMMRGKKKSRFYNGLGIFSEAFQTAAFGRF